jgi:hypothetical protein
MYLFFILKINTEYRTRQKRKIYKKRERKKERKNIITLEQYITRTIHDLPHFIKYEVTLKIHAHNIVFAY